MVLGELSFIIFAIKMAYRNVQPSTPSLLHPTVPTLPTPEGEIGVKNRNFRLQKICVTIALPESEIEHFSHVSKK